MRSSMRPLLVWLCCLGYLFVLVGSSSVRAQAVGGNNHSIEETTGTDVELEEAVSYTHLTLPTTPYV